MRERHATRDYGSARTLGAPLYTIAELARLLGVSRTHVYALGIPYVLVGDRRRFRPEDVDAYLEARKVETG